MNTNFVFPPPQAPTPRPAPPSASPTSPTGGSNPVNRESNALRASVLDAALELGIGTNGTVANWMFNNSLPEVEEEDQRSPALTYGSTATSEESASSGRFALASASSPASANPKSAQAPDINLFPVPKDRIRLDTPVGMPARTATVESQPFSDISIIPPRPVTPLRGKLRKKRGDGYESDGGYMSDVGKKKKVKDKKDKKKSGSKEGNSSVDDEAQKKERAKEAKNRAKEEKLQEKKEKEEERKRKKSMLKVKKGQAEDKDGYATGYETDGTPVKGAIWKTSKSKASGDADYETDSGYLSSTSVKSKSKSRFFGLGSKRSKHDLRQEEVPAMPTAVVPKDPVLLPIASKFATTIALTPASVNGSLNNISTTSMDPPPMTPVVASPPVPVLAAPTPTALQSPTSPTASPPVPAPAAPTPTALQSPTSPTAVTSDHRESYGSGESGESVSRSSSTSHSKRRGIQFFTQGSAHDHGSGSYSTTISATQVPLPQSAVTSPTSPSKIHPVISLPLSHTTSLSPTRGVYPSTNGAPFSKQPSSSSTPTSPSVLSPPVVPISRNPSPTPAPAAPRTPFLQATFPSSVGSATSSPRPRPRFPPTDGFGPRLTPSTSASVSAIASPSPLPRSPSPFLRPPSRQGTDRPSLTIIPSTSYIVPSPRASPLPLPSPNVLAYYDIPPPSPPPAGPLPSVPAQPPPGSFAPHARAQDGGRSGGGTSNGNRSSLVHSRTPEQGLFSQPIPSIQRGREAPFPPRPILPGAVQGNSASGARAGAGSNPGLEARVKIPRYRELYGLALPQEQDHRAGWRRRAELEGEDEQGQEIDEVVVEPSDGGWEDLEYDEQDEEDMRDVLERFEEARMGREKQHGVGRALGRNQSFEAIRKRIFGRGDGSGEGDGSDLDYRYEDEDEDGDADGSEEVVRKLSTSTESGDRSNRWSGSIYSRVSVLDPEKSEEARQRFIKRVEDLYGDDGREKIVPPVPKIPDAFVGATAAGRSWNRF